MMFWITPTVVAEISFSELMQVRSSQHPRALGRRRADQRKVKNDSNGCLSSGNKSLDSPGLSCYP